MNAQVGFSAPAVTSSFPSEAQPEVVDSNIVTRSAIKLSELCESSFLLKRGRKKRKAKGAPEVPKPKNREIVPKVALPTSETKCDMLSV